MTTQKINLVYSTVLLLVTILIWRLIYYAQFLEYDLNILNLLLAFILSIGAITAITIMWFRRRQIIRACKWQTILFLIISSPITVVLVSIYYPTVFGTMLKN